MPEHLVLDANLFVVSLLRPGRLNPEELRQRPAAREYVRRLQARDLVVHLPRLALAEVCGAIARRSIAQAQAVERIFAAWTEAELVRWYDLDSNRMHQAVEVAILRRLRGGDSIYAALADELGMSLRTYDTELLERSPRAATP
jgi:predicted nucleic acid-binding protein